MPVIDLNSPDGADKIARILEKRTTDLMRMATIEFYRQVQISTPVDTGRARAGWLITVNTPSDEVLPEGKYTYSAVTPDVPAITINDRYFITNNTPYIGKLNNGYSRQAPARFVEAVVARVQAAVSKIWAKIK
jgi:hypothetical protein